MDSGYVRLEAFQRITVQSSFELRIRVAVKYWGEQKLVIFEKKRRVGHQGKM